MTVKDLIEKLETYLPDVEVCLLDKFKNVTVQRKDIAFRMQKYQDESSPRPYYRLELYIPDDGDASAEQLYNQIQEDDD